MIDEKRLAPAIDLIKEFEGRYLKAYLDPVKIPTIGYGTIKYPNGSAVKMGDMITQDAAVHYLYFEVAEKAAAVEAMVKVKISDNSFCALVSFAYNVGIGALKKSTLLRKLNAGEDLKAVASQFDRWVNAGGKPLKGLVRRRKAEKDLFLA